MQVTARAVLHSLLAAFLIIAMTASSLPTRFPRRAVEPPFCTTAFSNTPYCLLVKYSTTRRASDGGVLTLHEGLKFSGGVTLCFGQFEPCAEVFLIEPSRDDLGLVQPIASNRSL